MTSIVPLSNLLGGVVLLCGFLQLYQRRVGAMLRLAQLASMALAVLALSRAVFEHEPRFYVAGLVVGLVGIGLKRCLCRWAQPYDPPVALVPMAVRLVLGLALVALVVAVMPPAYQGMQLALSVLLLALLLMLVQAHKLIWLIGLAAMVNGLVLAVISLPSLPDIAVWVGLLPILPLAGVLVWCRTQEASL